MSRPDSHGSDPSAERLESWKEIAAYLKRGVTTVQRWEQQEGLPVHRHQHDTRGSVYALKSELEPWRASRHPVPIAGENQQEAAAESSRKPWAVRTGVVIGFAFIVLSALALWVGLYLMDPSGASAPISGVQIFPVEELQEGPGSAVAISPDGRQLVYVGWHDGIDQLYARAINDVTSTPLRGTEHARSPFFSPDGKWVGFFAENHLKKVRLESDEVETICATTGNPAGATWSANNIIVFAGFGSGLRVVSARGGEPSQFSVPDVAAGEVDHRWPEVVPGRDAVLFTIWRGAVSDAQVAVESFKSRKRSILLPGTQPRMLGTDYLLFVRGDGLWAAPFHLDSLTAGNNPTRLLDTVLPRYAGAADYSVGHDGALAHVPSRYESRNTLEWVDQNAVTPIAEDKLYSSPRLSPDGTKIAVMTRNDDGRFDVWIYDLAEGSRIRLPTQGSALDPIWTPDGTRITFGSARLGTSNLYWIPADGKGEQELLLRTDVGAYPLSWSPNGRTLAYLKENTLTGSDVWFLSLDGISSPLLTTPYRESAAAFSPDGRWLAYVSNQTGKDEVYVMPYGERTHSQLVSKGGGNQPVWARDGSALYYRGLSGNILFKAPVVATPHFSVGAPVVLLDGPYQWMQLAGTFAANYDVARDQRFIMIRQPHEVRQEIRVRLDWVSEVVHRIPRK